MTVQDAHGPAPSGDEQPSPFGAALRAELAKRARALGRTVQRLSAPTDAEAVHDVRVAARRLQSALWLWRDQLAQGRRGRVRRQVRRLRRGLGRARELQVHAALLRAQVHEGQHALRLAVEPLLARWERRAARAQRGAAARLTPALVRRIRARIERAILVDAVVPDPFAGARARLERRRTEANDAIQSALAQLGEASFHRARIAVKKLRYTAESYAALSGSEPQPLGPLRDLQQALGDLHDATLLEGRVQRHHAKLHARGLAENAETVAGLRGALARQRHDEEVRVRRLVGWSSPKALPAGGRP